jgi:hypothetical protein
MDTDSPMSASTRLIENEVQNSFMFIKRTETEVPAKQQPAKKSPGLAKNKSFHKK